MPVTAIISGDKSNVTESEFISYVRENVGDYGSDNYWKMVYSSLSDKSAKAIEKRMGRMGIDAIVADATKFN